MRLFKHSRAQRAGLLGRAEQLVSKAIALLPAGRRSTPNCLARVTTLTRGLSGAAPPALASICLCRASADLGRRPACGIRMVAKYRRERPLGRGFSIKFDPSIARRCCHWQAAAGHSSLLRHARIGSVFTEPCADGLSTEFQDEADDLAGGAVRSGSVCALLCAANLVFMRSR